MVRKVTDIKTAKKILKGEIDGTLQDADLDLVAFNDEVKLKEMNDKHAFINSVGGRPMILCYTYSEVFDRKIVEFRTPDSIKTQYSNHSVQIGTSTVELGKWWIKNADRREYDTVIFDPSKEQEHNNCFNLWEGFTIKPNKGIWKKTLKHLYIILCNKDRDKFLYLIKWLAWMVQNPATRAEVAIAFKGKEGAGKGFIFSQFVQIFGIHGMSIANREHLTGKFNGHLSRVVFLFADEAYYPGDKEVEGVLKQLITEERIPYRALYSDAVLGANRLHIAMSTNAEWVIPAGDSTRRYFINLVDNRYAKNQCSDQIRDKYFKELWGEMANGGREAMLHDLLKLKLDNWHPRANIPETDELQKQREISLPHPQKVFLDFLEEGFFPGEYTLDNQYIVPSDRLYEYIDELDNFNKKITPRAKGIILNQLKCAKIHKRDKNYWLFPDLKVMREKWDDLHGRHKWEEQENWSTSKKEY